MPINIHSAACNGNEISFLSYDEWGCSGNDVAPRPSATKANQEWALACWFGEEKFDDLHKVITNTGPSGTILDEYRAIDNQWFEQYRRENDHIPDIRKMV